MTIDFDVIVPQYTPDVQIETDWTGGLTGLPRDVKKLLLLGYKTSAGSATAGQVKRFGGLTEAIGYWGKGSHLACMAEKALAIAPRSPLYGVSYAEGGAATAAAGTIAITGTKATVAGTFVFYIAGKRFQVGVAVDDTPTLVGDAIAAAVNGHANCPVTAVNVTGTVTMTARNLGPMGNAIKMRGEATVGCAGLTFTTAAALSTGATEGDPTTVLAGIESDRFHLVAINTTDSTTLGKLKTDREKQSGVAVKKWGLGIAACVDTKANAETLRNAVESYRMQIVWHQASEVPPWEIAAAFGALRATKAANRSLDDLTLAGVTPQYDETKWPTSGDIEEVLELGIVPLRCMREGTVQVVRSVIAVDAGSYLDHNPIEISDYADEYLINLFVAQAKGKPLKVGSSPGTPTTITPARAAAIMNRALYKLDKADYLQGVESAVKAGYNVAEVNGTDPNRLDCAWQFWPIAFAHFIAMRKTYVVSGS